MGRILGRLALSLLPLALTPGLGFLVAEGYVNLGAGCKDILALIPLLVWAFAYFICSLVFWWKGTPVLRTMMYAALWAAGFMALMWVILLLSQVMYLGVKGLS
jgi:hypothetical protein